MKCIKQFFINIAIFVILLLASYIAISVTVSAIETLVTAGKHHALFQVCFQVWETWEYYPGCNFNFPIDTAVVYLIRTIIWIVSTIMAIIVFSKD